jgi:hypothetical protein
MWNAPSDRDYYGLQHERPDEDDDGPDFEPEQDPDTVAPWEAGLLEVRP